MSYAEDCPPREQQDICMESASKLVVLYIYPIDDAKRALSCASA